MTWDGAWLSDKFGFKLGRRDHGVGRDPRTLVGLALRRNTKRPHLLVSTVLGKHVPAEPSVVIGAGVDLADEVHSVLEPRDDGNTLVIGFAETATELGHRVAIRLGLPYLHSTRCVPLEGDQPLRFEEEHSHATTHFLNPEDPNFLPIDGAVVLVDDELSTGQTAMNTIAALHAHGTGSRFVVAALVDMRTEAAITQLSDFARQLDIEVAVVSLAAGRIHVPEDTLSHASFGSGLPETSNRASARGVQFHTATAWPAKLPQGGARGVSFNESLALAVAADNLAADLASALAQGSVHVLGVEEMMHLPLQVAASLTNRGLDITYSSTTRSPVVILDEDGYAVRTGLSYSSLDGAGTRYAYNVPEVDHIVTFLEQQAEVAHAIAPGGLVTSLAGLARSTHVVVLQ